MKEKKQHIKEPIEWHWEKSVTCFGNGNKNLKCTDFRDQKEHIKKTYTAGRYPVAGEKESF